MGGSDVLKKLKEDHDAMVEKLDSLQNTRDQILQRIGGVEARAERNETRIEAIRTLLEKYRADLIPELAEGEDSEEANDKVDEALEELYTQIEEEFGTPPSLQMRLRNQLVKLHTRSIPVSRSSNFPLIKCDDKNVAAMQRFIADGRNQAFRDELVLDLEEGYSEITYSSFEQVRKQIEEEDLAKNHERFEELLRVQVPEEVSGFSEALESHRDRIRKRVNELNEHLSRVTFDRKEITYIQLMIEDAGDDGVRRFKKLRRHALEGDLESDDDDERRRERYHRVEQFLGELEQDLNWTERVIDVRNWFKFRADEFYKEEDTLRQSYSGAAGKSGGRKTVLHRRFWLPQLPTNTVLMLGVSKPRLFVWLQWMKCSVRPMMNFPSIYWTCLKSSIYSC